MEIDKKKLLELIDKVDDSYCEVRASSIKTESKTKPIINELNSLEKIIDKQTKK